MNPEIAVVLFNGICIAGGALIAGGSIYLLERTKKNRNQTSKERPTFEVIPDDQWLKDLPRDVQRARKTVADGAVKARKGIPPK